MGGRADVTLLIRAMASAVPLRADNLPGRLSALRRHFEISLYLLLLTGVLTLVSTGKLDLVSILLLPAALLFLGAIAGGAGKGSEISNRVGTWLTIGYFVFFPFDLWIVSRILARDAQNPGLYAALLATIHLMLFAIVVRLYSASTTRDYLFLTMMAFATMLASAILTVDTVFLVFFFVFLALAVSTFVGLEMWKSAQGAVTPPLESGTGAAQHLHNALGVTSLGIAFGAVAIGAVIFFVLPRFNSGYMSGFNLQPTLISGFSDDVELGEIGEIKKSSVVVMRISVEGGMIAARGMHWRGIALTEFDGKRWFNEPHEPTTLLPTSEGWFRLHSGEPQLAGIPIPLHRATRTDRKFGAVRGKRRGQRPRAIQWRCGQSRLWPAPRLSAERPRGFNLQSVPQLFTNAVRSSIGDTDSAPGRASKGGNGLLE